MRQLNEFLSTKIKQSKIVATDSTIRDIVNEEIYRLGVTGDLNHIDVSNVTDMTSLFSYCNKKFNGDISKWDVSKVQIFDWMFYQCKKFTGDLSNWNVTKECKSLRGMFCEADKFNSDVSNWDVQNVTTISKLFDGCREFNCDLSRWDVRNCTEYNFAFRDCIRFECDLSKWKLNDKARGIQIFRGCSSMRKEYFPGNGKMYFKT